MKKLFPLLIVLVLLAGFAVRLYKIDNPLADWHSWRQADTSAVTRNYFKFGINLLYPRYDDFSDVSAKGLFNPEGYRFVEFPIFNLIHYAFASAFPFKSLEYWGRMTSILTSLVSAVILYFIVKRSFGKFTGFLAMMFFLFLPYNIYYSRVVLPDPLMVTLFLGTLNFFDLWTRTSKKFHLILTLIFGTLAVLVKPVAIFFLFPIIYQLWKKYGWKFITRPVFYLIVGGLLIPYSAWWIWEHQFPQGIPSNFWLLNGNHIRFKGAFFRWIFGERLGALILGNWGTYPLMAGIISAISRSGYFVSWLVGPLVFVTVFATGSIQHDYYQIPLIPSISIMLALGTVFLFKSENSFVKTWAKRGVVVISLVFMFAFSWYTVKGYYQVNHWEIVHAGQAVDRLTPKDAIVAAPYGGDTAFLYQTNRRGFAHLVLPIKDLKDRYNASYFVSVDQGNIDTQQIVAKYTVIEKTPEYVIVKLEEPSIRP